jgi:hypothetical protein
MARRVSSQRDARSICVALVALAVLSVDVATAGALSLPLETPTVPIKVPPVTVKTPPVTVKVPPVTVKTPPVTVKTPPVTIKTPTVPVQAPPVTTPPAPVKAPTTPVKVPTVPAKAPTVKAPTVSTGSTKAPNVTVGAPSVSAKAPGVSVKGGGASGSVSGGGVNAPGVSVAVHPASGSTPSTPGRLGVEQRAGTSSPGAPLAAAAAPDATAAPLGGYGSLGTGYGRIPASEGRQGSKARARIASRERKLKATVARERACLSSLPEQQQQLLVLRSGLEQAEPLSPRATAARLHLRSARFARLEAQALRELGDASAHGCRQTGTEVAKIMAFLGSSFGGPQARGAVEAARYEAGPGLLPPPASSGDTGLLGTKLSPVASDAILALAALLVLALATIAIVADATGNGPRHAQWRRHVRNRVRDWR